MSKVELHLGDCLEVMREMDAGSVDAVITDPPYNSNLNYEIYKDNLPSDSYWAWLKLVIEECKRISRNIVIIKHSSGKIFDWCDRIGKSRMLVWYKPFSSGFRLNGFATHFEPLWVVQGSSVNWSKDVIIHNSGNSNPEKSTGHPAQMPVGLAKKLIDICAGFNNIVFDPFMGSGTTGVACVETGRNFIGIEIDPHYFEIAQQRIEDAQRMMAGKPKVLRENGRLEDLPLFGGGDG